MFIMKVIIMMEMVWYIEIFINQIVIFGVIGDLVKKKLIFVLYKLYKKDLFLSNFVIVGIFCREIVKEIWVEFLGEYFEDFFYCLDWISIDLNNLELLYYLLDVDDLIYFLFVLLERYENVIINFKEVGLFENLEFFCVVIEKFFGYDYKFVDCLLIVVVRCLCEK